MGTMENIVEETKNTVTFPELYERIQTANATIKTTDIKGKMYAEVNQRIKAFRMVYPDGFIRTKMMSNENGVCVFRAEVGIYETNTESYLAELVIGTGTAYEKEDSTFINKTSYIENCETSAVGRALGMAGFGIDTSVASAEEVETAIVNQDANKLIPKTKAKALEGFLSDNGILLDTIYKLYKVKSLSELTESKHRNITEHIKDIKESQNGK